MGENWNLIHLNIKKWKCLRFFNIFLASLCSLVGTISIVEFLIVLNSIFSVGYFMCVSLAFVLSRLYSFIVNEVLLIKIENKMDNVRLETIKLLDYAKTKDNLKLETNSLSLVQKFENLSSQSKIELLMYVKNDLENIDKFRYDDLSFEQERVLEEADDVVLHLGEGRSKSRNIREEIRKEY